jgi:glycerol kinase
MAPAQTTERHMQTLLMAIDQGTTSTRALLFDSDARLLGIRQKEITQHFPHDGWVEHDAGEIWHKTLAVCRELLADYHIDASRIAAIGITNQRETTVLWDRATGKPVANAIVWQDRRTAASCQALKDAGHEPMIMARTGLLLDPYFSASKLRWLLDNIDGAREQASRGNLAFGTIDSFLLWHLTGGKRHCTDASNAARTLLFDIHRQQWDDELLALFDIPRCVLPDVTDCVADFGTTDPALFGRPIAIGGMAGDQQAALIGQACFTSGMAKSTYGTGCFLVMNTGAQALRSGNRLLTTVAYRLDGKPCYAIEGSIFIAGAAVQWLRDGIHLIGSAHETEQLAQATHRNHGVYLVPAFTGLGAPYWDPDARGAIFGLTRNTGIAELVSAGLQSVCFQTRDLLCAMEADGISPQRLRIDGGMVRNGFFSQSLADILGLVVERPTITETTALGAAFLAGLQAGVYSSLQQIAALWQRDTEFAPAIAPPERDALYHGWLNAVARVRTQPR